MSENKENKKQKDGCGNCVKGDLFLPDGFGMCTIDYAQVKSSDICAYYKGQKQYVKK